MRLTNMTDYALRLLMFLAQQPERLCTVAEIASHHDISEAHLRKITHQLALAGWIATVRGKGGGMRLALPPQDIVLGDVVRSMEPDFFIVECFATGGRCLLTGNCNLTRVIDGALSSFMQQLDGHTLADILPTPAQARAVQLVRVRLPARASRA
jgi:Rrf2 family nitric oxide-sensitive transcriptional repressor